MKRSDRNAELERQRQALDWERSVRALFDSVWNATLGEALRHRSPSAREQPLDATRQARVSIRGEWNGTITLSCSESTAREFAASLFRKRKDALAPEDVGATVRELVNILGGNLKGLLPGVNTLSLPEDEAGPRGALPSKESPGHWTLHLDFRGWPVLLSLDEQR